MIGSFEVLYQILDRYTENDIDETEHAFINSLKWPDSYVLRVYDMEFWKVLQRIYGIHLMEEEKKRIVTVQDLKREVEYVSF